MELKDDKQREQLLAWYASQRPLTVDIVGDFAGHELFAVHGESLIRHCLEESKVDFDDGFQLLHAVYAVEHFLSNLYQRGCNFDIIFFSDLKDTCVPAGCAPGNAYKYQLARSVLIRHLSRGAPKALGGVQPSVHEFESPEDSDFEDYLHDHAVHFVLCHEGDDGEKEDTILLRQMIYEFISGGKNVAVINYVEWKSSKIFAPLLSGTNRTIRELDFDFEASDNFEVSEEGQTTFDEVEDTFDQSSISGITPTLRMAVSVAICQAIRETTMEEDEKEVDERIKALLLHTAMIHSCSLIERQCAKPRTPQTAQEKEDRGFIREFSEVAHLMFEDEHSLISEEEEEGLEWDLYDLVDGRIFLYVLQKLRKGEAFPESVVGIANALIKAALGESSDDLQTTPDTESSSAQPAPPSPAVMAFSHPIFDDLLKDIKLKEAPEKHDPAADVIFEDLTHWHNASKSIAADRKPAKLGFWAMRRNQRMMDDMVSYSASLTNARGKTIDPETIVVKKALPPSKQGKDKKGQETNGNSGGGKKKGGKKGGAPQKGGKQAALEAAKAVQQRKIEAQSNTVVRHWAEMCAEFEKDRSLVSRYLKADRFAYDKSSKENIAALGAEVELYMCNILGKIWDDFRDEVGEDGPEGLYLIAMAWNCLQQCAKIETTPAVAQVVRGLVELLGMPTIPVKAGNQIRKLAFSFDIRAFKPVRELVTDYRALQLEYGGPYMDRRFDSKPDDRVRFEPDAWQRDVLDAIDANNSLLVIAPTSAGKTFISFYAMKKVLEQSDDGVLVYVAPTKALVNQIAAEIQAQFSKSYAGQGAKSVWAIHTRDYRINNPTGCQVLVTVPHVLQIMLLSPHNATGPNSWSQRVKRIIFDEVHSIGQSEDGVIWEQLLLLAPCPIIALSATVGNPEDFRDWLARSQDKKGYKMELVVHKVRYSELRKFIYEPPKEFVFKGLQKALRLPVPGLDEGNTQCENLKFLHPVVALTDRNRGALADVSLEARDCFTLYNELKELLSEEDMEELDIQGPPDVLPEVITKADVIQWETNLKEALRKGMETRGLAFQKLRARFEEDALELDDPVDHHTKSLFALACDLHAQNALPALVFNYDRMECEKAAQSVLSELLSAEEDYKKNSSSWKATLRGFEEWQREKPKKPLEVKLPKRTKDEKGDSLKISKIEITKAETSVEASQWESFDPEAPLEQYSFADHSKLLPSEFEELTTKLSWEKLNPWLINALLRGIGVHHAGMNRRYRQIVEILFRKGFLRLVVATGTLALGINMPCKTVVFSGDSIFLTAQNYRQASGRAGRRGFDLLGNVVFNGIPRERVYEIMSSRLPDLRGQFPISTTLILRLFGLLHGTKNSEFAVRAISSLLSQTRLYLGGPESEDSIKHHLRFSIEYLRRQHLLSDKGVPLNFSGLVGHLYFTENSVFAFHSLIKGGYFHKLCANIEKNPEKVMSEMMLILSHLFHRIPAKKTPEFAESVHRSPSMVFLPRLPEDAEKLLLEHNAETLSIFKDYVHSYINNNLDNKPDRTLPFTKTTVGKESGVGNAQDGPKPCIRSPFVALSGFKDDFQSIHELCSTVRDDVFLEESAIPYIPIWPHDTDVEFNAYLHDFFKHGSMDVLVRDNRIKGGDVWFLLKDFSLTLASIVASLENLGKAEAEGAGGNGEEDIIDMQEIGENPAETAQIQRDIALEKSKAGMKTKKVKKQLNDDWDQDEDDEDDEGSEGEARRGSDSRSNSGSEDWSQPAWQQEGGGLAKVLKAFTMLRDEFDTKFKKVWA